jgi:hypothetical protein
MDPEKLVIQSNHICMWMRGMSDMNGDDDKIMRGNNDDGGDLILHFLLGDIYLPYLEL